MFRSRNHGGVSGVWGRRLTAFTLKELVVVVALVALLLLLGATGLRSATEDAESAVCLSNLRSLGVAIRTYAHEYADVLPGPVHPALFHTTDFEPPPLMTPGHSLPRILLGVLGPEFNDRVMTCPTMAAIVSDARFYEYCLLTGRSVFPFHYALNNVGPVADGAGAYPAARSTRPSYYFGYAGPGGSGPPDYELQYPPQRIGRVANADREWMVADAWYRSNSSPFQELRQEGPCQSYWSGEAVPNFAPHGRYGTRTYVFLNSSQRNAESAVIRNAKSDGVTNTLFFDGHAAPVASRTLLTPTGLPLLYGFRGTVNPLQQNPPADHPVWDCVWR